MPYVVTETSCGPRIAWEGGSRVYAPLWSAANHAVMLLQRIERALANGSPAVEAGFLPPYPAGEEEWTKRPMPVPEALGLAHDLFTAALNALCPVVVRAEESAAPDGAHAATDLAEVPAGELDRVGGE